MKRWQQRLVVFGLFGLFMYFFLSQYQKETPYSRRVKKDYVDPFIQAEIYGVVTKVRRTDLDPENLAYGRRSKEFYYFDFKENWEKHFDTGLSEPIQVGDTIRKPKGTSRFSLTRKGKGLFYISNPMDSKRP